MVELFTAIIPYGTVVSVKIEVAGTLTNITAADYLLSTSDTNRLSRR